MHTPIIDIINIGLLISSSSSIYGWVMDDHQALSNLMRRSLISSCVLICSLQIHMEIL